VLVECKERKPPRTDIRPLIRRESAASTYLALGAVIAAIAPWGIALNAAPVHSSALRVCLLLAMGVTGLFFARRTGLYIVPVGLRNPVRRAIFIGATLAAYLLLIDDLVFKSAPIAVDLPGRLVYFVSRSISEGIVYQLFLGSMLVWLIGLIWREEDRIAPGAYWAGLLLAHGLNLCVNAAPTDLTYGLLRFVVPGVLWVYLYRRHGLTTTLVAHASTHVFLQPLLGLR
jgi:hypothetical protein